MMKCEVKLDFANVTLACDDYDNLGMKGWNEGLG